MEKISVFGLGRVGLPLALSFAEENCKVVGVDVDKKKLEGLEKKVMPFLEEGAEPLLKKHLNSNLHVTDNVKYAVDNSNYLVLTLGTPIDENFNPVLSQIESVLKDCKPLLRKEQTLLLRSTLSPGTTEYTKRFLEKDSDLKVGENFYLAFCPERISEGHAVKELRELPQIIGAFDEKSKSKAKDLFGKLTDRFLFTDPKSAELAKLCTNMYRYINFAIGNEFMMIAEDHGKDIYEITRLVNEGYKRGGLTTPGLAAGPCLYKDGFFLVEGTPFTELIASSWKINESTPSYLIQKIKSRKKLDKEKVALLGLAFKANIDDFRNSLSYKAKKILLREGAEVYTHDPFIKKESLEKTLENAGIVFLATNHKEYKKLDLEYLKKYVKEDCLVVDIWNTFNTGKIFFDLKGNYGK